MSFMNEFHAAQHNAVNMLCSRLYEVSYNFVTCQVKHVPAAVWARGPRFARLHESVATAKYQGSWLFANQVVLHLTAACNCKEPELSQSCNPSAGQSGGKTVLHSDVDCFTHHKLSGSTPQKPVLACCTCLEAETDYQTHITVTTISSYPVCAHLRHGRPGSQRGCKQSQSRHRHETGTFFGPALPRCLRLHAVPHAAS